MISISRYEQRLKALLIKRKFPERLQEISPVRYPDDSNKNNYFDFKFSSILFTCNTNLNVLLILIKS